MKLASLSNRMKKNENYSDPARTPRSQGRLDNRTEKLIAFRIAMSHAKTHADVARIKRQFGVK